MFSSTWDHNIRNVITVKLYNNLISPEENEMMKMINHLEDRIKQTSGTNVSFVPDFSSNI